MLMGDLPTAHFDQLADAMQDGHASVKIFTTDIIPGSGSQLMMPHGHIWEALKVVAAQGGIACIHAEDNDIVMFMYDKLMRENRVHFEHLAEVHNTLSEELSFNRVIRLAENVEGAALYMVHVSAATGVAALELSRARGFPMYGETLHQYLMYNAEDYKRPGGQMYHTYPSLKYPEDQKRLWEATNRGAIQAIATDELCCPLRAKLQGSRIDDVTGGNAGVEPRVGLMYTQMVTKRGYSPAHFVDMISSNAARILGLYPRKGALAVGSDADIVLLQTGIEKTIRRRRPARDRLHALGRARGDGVADRHHPARQGGRAGRRLPAATCATGNSSSERWPTKYAAGPPSSGQAGLHASSGRSGARRRRLRTRPCHRAAQLDHRQGDSRTTRYQQSGRSLAFARGFAARVAFGGTLRGAGLNLTFEGSTSNGGVG